MTPDMWKDMLEAATSWIDDVKSGYAVDSASRLLDRLWTEHYVGANVHTSSHHLQRHELLIQLQRRMVRSWLECAIASGSSHSTLALSKAELSFWRSVEFANEDTSFPIDEYTALIEACLSLDDSDAMNQEIGADQAAKLLWKIFSADTTDQTSTRMDRDVMSQYADQIVPLFEKCVVQVLQVNPKSSVVVDLLEIMSELKHSDGWSDLTLPAEAERILLESSLEKSEKEQQQHQQQFEPKKRSKQSSTSVSQFEKDALERRLIDFLEGADPNDRNDLESLIDRTTKLDPSSTLISVLIRYYVRMNDIEKSSLWLQRLDDDSLRSSPKLVEEVMSLWSKQKGQRIPWRADELFKSITSRMQNPQTGRSPLDLSCFKIVLDIWASSGDPGADRKILDCFSSMGALSIQPDGATLRLVLQSVQKEKAAPILDLICEQILEQWNFLNYEDKVWLAEEVMSASASVGVETSKTVSVLMNRLRYDNIKPTPSVYRSALKAIQPPSGSPSDVLKLVDSFENNLDEMDLPLYTLAIHTLFQFENSMSEVEMLSINVLNRLQKSIDGVDTVNVSEFLESVVRMYTHRKLYPAAGNFIKNAEKSLLPSSNSEKSTQGSPIPLVCYKLMIVRKWYTNSTSPAVKRTFEHLMTLYESGYETLRPDSEIYSGYMRACLTLGEDVRPILDEMIDVYKSTGDEAFKPSTEAFNTVLLGYSRQNIKKIRAGNKSVRLIELMLDLDVKPDTKSLNFALHNVTKASSQYSFEMATKILETLEKHNCLPEFDSFSLHYILDACAGDSTVNSDVALKKCLSTFRVIREKDMIGSTTYGILSKVLERLLSKGDRADKVAGSIFALCCQDGRLTNEVRDRLRSIISHQAWVVQYERNLAPNGQEPEEWSCNSVPSDSDAEDVA